MLTEIDVLFDNASFRRNSASRNSTPIRDLSLVSYAPTRAFPPPKPTKSKRRQSECKMPSLVLIKPRAANRTCRIRSNRPLTISSPPRCDTPDDMPLSMLNRFSEVGFGLPLPSLTPIRSVSSAVVGSTYIDEDEATYRPKTRDLYAPGTSRDIYVEKQGTQIVPSKAKHPSPAPVLVPEEPPRKIFKKCDPSKANLIKSSKRGKRGFEPSDRLSQDADPSSEFLGPSQVPSPSSEFLGPSQELGPISDPLECSVDSGLTTEATISESSLAMVGSNSASSGSSQATVGFNQVDHVSVGSSSVMVWSTMIRQDLAKI